MMKKKGLSHGLLMLVCCLVPMVALVAFLPQIRNSTSGFNWSWLIFLLCPLMHIFMMKGMHGDEKSCHDNEKEDKGAEDKTEYIKETVR